jgi:hypothetical protein
MIPTIVVDPEIMNTLELSRKLSLLSSNVMSTPDDPFYRAPCFGRLSYAAPDCRPKFSYQQYNAATKLGWAT